MLKLNEIFFSIQGESSQAGRPCIFIRLTGCKLRCTYCDTKYAYFEGEDVTEDEIIRRIKAFPCNLVELTGGEPLEHKIEAPKLLQRLLDEGYEVMLETDGVEDISVVPQGVRIIMDVKTPGSKMANPKSAKNLPYLKPTDEIKFVICDEKDYLFSKAFIEEHKLAGKHTLLMSPVMLADKDAEGGQKSAAWLPEKILADGLPVRFQMQMHKVLWGDKRGV
jgi:7-carboxy-7-deazaguanine synthase